MFVIWTTHNDKADLFLSTLHDYNADLDEKNTVIPFASIVLYKNEYKNGQEYDTNKLIETISGEWRKYYPIDHLFSWENMCIRAASESNDKNSCYCWNALTMEQHRSGKNHLKTY